MGWFDTIRRTLRRGRAGQSRERGLYAPVLEALQRSPLFDTMASSHLRSIAEIVHVRNYRRDEFIYFEGDPGIGLYLIYQGRVRLITTDEEGNDYELRQVTEGEAFGIVSVLGDFRRTESAQAVVDTRVLGLYSPDLKSLMKRKPHTAAELLLVFARHVAGEQTGLLKTLASRVGHIEAMRLLQEANLNAGADDIHEPFTS